MGSSSPSEDLSTEELFRRFAPFVARFLYRLGVASDGLDDCVQEVFLVVHRRGGYKAGPAKPTSYLATIATNAASAHRRRRRIEQARSSDTEVEGLVSTNKGPVQILEVSERLRLLQAALERLEPDFRSTLVLADIEGESCTSIAASSGVPTGTVYWRLHEARKRFQRALRAEMAGIPARPLPPEGQEAPKRRERRSALAFALNPLWFLSDARRLLRDGATHAPVHYDINSGLEAHRRLASTAGPSQAPTIANVAAMPAGSGIGLAGAAGGGIAAIAAVAAVFFMRALPSSHPGGHSAEPTTAVASSILKTEAPPSSAAAAISATAEPAETTAVLEAAPAPRAASSSTTTVRGDVAKASAAQRTPSSSAPPAPKEVSQPTAPASAAPSAPRVVTNDTQLEAQEVARAERLLSSNPAGALSIVRAARARYRPSFLPEERDYVEVMALHALGRTSEADAAATHFLRAYPGGAFSNRVRKVMGR